MGQLHHEVVASVVRRFQRNLQVNKFIFSTEESCLLARLPVEATRIVPLTFPTE